jgi:2-succinyl-6-hydroxy-2,4-cyclohexadiene-1-carboxylate synthase
LLLLVGEWDEKFRAINAQIVGLTPNAELAIIANSGHTIHLENADEWVTRVKQFCT